MRRLQTTADPFGALAGLVLSLTLAGCTGSDRPSSPRPSIANPPAASTTSPAAKMVDAPPNVAVNSVANPHTDKPTPPPYDLSADRDRRVKVAKEELGDKTVTSVVSEIFVVIGPAGWQGRELERSVSLFRSAMTAYLNHRFTKKPTEAISVYLFPEKTSYEAFCARKYNAPCIAHYGFYQPNDRYMVMNIGLGLGTLTHEIVHPLVEADFPSAPTWINEGIASVFEQPILGKPGEIHGGKNWRHPRLKQALLSSEKEKARLDRLFGMHDDTFRGSDEDLHYALARYVCQWLDDRGKLWPFYQRWRDNVADDPTGEKAFKEVMGMTPTEANPQWTTWAIQL